jgi:PRC-barrel domain
MKRGSAPTVASIAALAALLFAGGPGSARVQARPAGAEAPSTSPDDAGPSKTVPSSPAETKPEDRPPPNLEPIGPSVAIPILGKKVRDASGKDMGLVVDVLVDHDGMVRAAVIDFGGFLGVGNRKIAIAWRLLQVNPTDRDAPIVLTLDRAQVQAAPEYKPSSPPTQAVGPPSPEGGSAPPGRQN